MHHDYILWYGVLLLFHFIPFLNESSASIDVANAPLRTDSEMVTAPTKSSSLVKPTTFNRWDDDTDSKVAFPHRTYRSVVRKVKRQVSYSTKLWPSGIVFYQLAESYSQLEKKLIRDAMDSIQGETCVKFIDYKNQRLPPGMEAGHRENYIRITAEGHEGECSSEIGYAPTGKSSTKQLVNLHSDCIKAARLGHVLHELIHTLGVQHQHTRPDRDDHVEIYWDNIVDAMMKDFTKDCDQSTYELPYDYNSVMHYINIGGSIRHSLRTLMPKVDHEQKEEICLGQRIRPTNCDLELIRHMYSCPLKKNCQTRFVHVMVNGSCNHLW